MVAYVLAVEEKKAIEEQKNKKNNNFDQNPSDQNHKSVNQILKGFREK